MVDLVNATSNILPEMDDQSKVWIYACNRPLRSHEVELIQTKIDFFTKNWTAHDRQLKASGLILNHQFIVLAVDGTQSTASGCSIDKSLHFIKNLESEFEISLLDRLTIYFFVNSELKALHFTELQEKIASGALTENALILDCSLTDLHSLRTKFVTQAKHTWLAKYF